MQLRATIDFESRSECSIRNCGTWKYSLDPTTEVLCLGFRLPYWPEGETGLWHPAFPHLGIEETSGTELSELAELFEWITDGGLVEAHNSFFEKAIWTNQCLRLGFPPLPQSQIRCSAAKAASHALPRALDDAIDALDLPIRKDMDGHKLMRKVTSPRKPVKADIRDWNVRHACCQECQGKGKLKIGRAKAFPCPVCSGRGYDDRIALPPLPTLWHESRELYERLWDYCRQDVLAEEALSQALPDLNEDETSYYAMDQTINVRGFALDVEAVEVALELIDLECVDLNRELAVLTGGQVVKATQRAKMIDWFASEGLVLEDTQKETIAGLLETRTDLTPTVRRGLEIVKVLGRSSTAKYETALDWVCPDGRIRGSLLFNAASTARWGGMGFQPHNLVRSKITDMEAAWTILKTRNRDHISQHVLDAKGESIGTVMDVLAHATRGVIVPSVGRQLYVADFNAIEARVVLWLAEDDKALDIFRRGEDIYCYMANDIYGYPCNKKDHPAERQLSKVIVLACSYQMGWSKFMDTAAAQGLVLTPEFSEEAVKTYRRKFWRVADMWKNQEACAIEAVHEPGMEVPCGRVTWFVEGRFLYCRLPSGRCLAYADPEVRGRPTPWGAVKDSLTFMGINGFNRQWQRQTTYGGALVENQCQSVARDLMAAAMLRCEESEDYDPVLSIHDELVSEADLGTGDVTEFEQLMATVPDWAQDCPVEAEGWRGLRYRK